MGKIVIELTNRCNLKCQHCFSGRHGGRDDLPYQIIDKILQEAKGIGFERLSFTGGDPTVYPKFKQVIKSAYDAGYLYSFNTNGQNFPTMYADLLPYRDQLEVITFSLDGATEGSHDRLRGKGSYRRVMQAVSICVIKELPFTFNMVVTAHNKRELKLMAESAAKLGARGLRFGHLMPTSLTSQQDFDLTPWERKMVEAEIRVLRDNSPIRIAMAPGYHTTDMFPCAPLNLQEINIDCHGFLTKCCHLSGYSKHLKQVDLIGDLHDISLSEAYNLLVEENRRHIQVKTRNLKENNLHDSDFFTCWYCSLYYNKVGWLKEIQDHPWSELIWNPGID
ncbi:radical SAM protein [Chloroflexota bacterium]